MRYKITLLLAAVVILTGLTLNVAPVTAQGPRGVFEQQGSGTVCTNVGALVFEKIPNVDVLKPFMDKCGDKGSWVAVQLYNWDRGSSEEDKKTSIHGLTAAEARALLKRSPKDYDSGSLWFEPGVDPTGAREVTGQIVETEGKGSFASGKGVLTFESLDSINQLKDFNCDGRVRAFQLWHSPGGQDDLLTVDNLTMNAALALLLKPPKNLNSGSFSCKPGAAVQPTTGTPLSLPTATLSPSVKPTPPANVAPSQDQRNWFCLNWGWFCP